MKRRIVRLSATLLAAALALAVGACGDAANNNDNLSGTSTVPGSSGGASPGDALPGGADGTGGADNPGP